MIHNLRGFANMYFLVVVALIGGNPQGVMNIHKDLPSCLAQRKEFLQMVNDPAVSLYSVECIKATEPKRAM